MFWDFKTEVIFETTFFCKKDCISLRKSQLVLCAPNTKCFTERFHPIGGAQGTSKNIWMHSTTWAKISSSLLVGIWFRQVTSEKPFRMLCEASAAKNCQVCSPSKCTSAEISGSNSAATSFADSCKNWKRCLLWSHKRKKHVLAQMRKYKCNVWEVTQNFSTGLQMGGLHCASFLRPIGTC